MDTEDVIKELKKSNLYAECPMDGCGGEFRLSDAILFDGTKPFPREAMGTQEQLVKQQKEREEELKERKKRATETAQATAKAVNIGKNLEKVLPTLKDYKWELPDSRFLGDPIDLITFNGLSLGRIESINFIEVKSGAARLNVHQKAIRDAIEDKKVTFKVFE